MTAQGCRTAPRHVVEPGKPYPRPQIGFCRIDHRLADTRRIGIDEADNLHAEVFARRLKGSPAATPAPTPPRNCASVCPAKMPTARARITQIFHNPTDGWVEAVYVYPMSEGGAVDTLKMVIGDRIEISHRAL